MGTINTKLRAPKKGFTMKDFEDGKCTKEGFPLGTEVIDEAPLVPEQPVDTQPTAEIPEETTSAPEPEVEVTVDEQPDEPKGE